MEKINATEHISDNYIREVHLNRLVLWNQCVTLGDSQQLSLIRGWPIYQSFLSSGV